MAEEFATSSTVREVEGVVDHAKHWVFLGGNRLVLAGGLAVGVFALFAALSAAGLVAVGPSSSASSLFASGLTAGTLTLVTVALSINQLILSRVFGSPAELMDTLEGTRDLRERVERWSDDRATPNDPADFLSVVAMTLSDRANRFDDALDTGSGDGEGDAAAGDGDQGDTGSGDGDQGDSTDRDAALERYASDIAAYGDNLEDKLESQTAIVDVLDAIIGTEYARNMTATDKVRATDDERFSEAARTELSAIHDLLEVIAVTRQFFKTLSLQQDFARLSRLLAYAGFLALLVSISMTLLYRSNGATVPESALPFVVSAGLAVIALPATIFIAYMLRAATIAHRTVSVGPFIPPAERSTDD